MVNLVISEYQKRRQTRLDAKKAELQQKIDAYHKRRDMRLDARYPYRHSVDEFRIRRDARLDAIRLESIEIPTPNPLTNARQYDKIIIRKSFDSEWNEQDHPRDKNGEFSSAAEIKPFKPTEANTKQFKTFDWVKEAKIPGIEISAVEKGGEAIGLVATRFSMEDRANGAIFIDLIERAGADNRGNGGENKGIGKLLISHVAKKAEKLGVDAVYLRPVTTAIPYYESLGFKFAGATTMVLEDEAFNKIKEGN